ncbi:MAG: class I SAM-dependent methyltransferase [bacterium]
MGLAKGAAKVLCKEAYRKPFKGRILTLGRQDIWFTYPLLENIAREFGVELNNHTPITLSHKPEFQAKQYISDDCLFKALGFSECKSLDFSDYESADYIFDLNCPDLPRHLAEAFDVIIDGGTIEHVFHLPNALHNIYKMLSQEGRIIHIAPSSNYIDHGFYMFSPILFWDFYSVNKFEINNFQVFRHTERAHIDPWEMSEYQSGWLNSKSFGGLDDGMYSIVCIATKSKNSTGEVIPQQGNFSYLWKGKDNQNALSKASFSADRRSQSDIPRRKRSLFYKLLRPLSPIICFLAHRICSKGLGLRVEDRY